MRRPFSTELEHLVSKSIKMLRRTERACVRAVEDGNGDDALLEKTLNFAEKAIGTQSDASSDDITVVWIQGPSVHFGNNDPRNKKYPLEEYENSGYQGITFIVKAIIYALEQIPADIGCKIFVDNSFIVHVLRLPEYRVPTPQVLEPLLERLKLRKGETRWYYNEAAMSDEEFGCDTDSSDDDDDLENPSRGRLDHSRTSRWLAGGDTAAVNAGRLRRFGVFSNSSATVLPPPYQAENVNFTTGNSNTITDIRLANELVPSLSRRAIANDINLIGVRTTSHAPEDTEEEAEEEEIDEDDEEVIDFEDDGIHEDDLMEESVREQERVALRLHLLDRRGNSAAIPMMDGHGLPGTLRGGGMPDWWEVNEGADEDGDEEGVDDEEWSPYLFSMALPPPGAHMPRLPLISPNWEPRSLDSESEQRVTRRPAREESPLLL
ncbi:hypothetical protein SeMB42_g05683 [Synchytrium endobioticum]|uniref:Uncharacterized protein n=1 Tax=Synchytrium endobioticum TaxID=286115 RepID=A0A507CPX5_9FUNG|nr:hypothetical protein SeMB42_g05683 [Synchytrium endobioticum]TPX43970.1 hypothetical protein SeLEV6574_g04785 [Synchytrium endobioticum]